MARMARVSVPGIPYHVTQRGNRRQKVFFNDSDKQTYLKILKDQCGQFKLSVWAYCLMDNHVHLIEGGEDALSNILICNDLQKYSRSSLKNN